MTRATDDCKGCHASVRIPAAEVQRILAEYVRDHPQEVIDEAAAAQRSAVCADCDDLQYGTTCRHCACLVAVRARLADKACPRPADPRW